MKTTTTTVHAIFPGGTQSGRWYNTTCPLCVREKLGITLESDGTVHTHCFVCGKEGKDDDVYDLVIEALTKGEPVTPASVPLKTKVHTFRFSEGQLRRAELALNDHPEAVDYLKSRGITLEVAQHNHTGYLDHYRIGPSIVMPTFNDKGELTEVKMRSLKGKRFDKTVKVQGEHWLYRGDCIPEAVLSGQPVMITESQLDAMAAQSAGYYAVSVDSANHKMCKADLEALKLLTRVLIAVDNDIDGHKCAQHLIKQLGAAKCLRIVPPKKDIGDLYDDHPKTFREAFRKLIRSAELVCPNFTWDDLLTEQELIDDQGLEIDYLIEPIIPRYRITMLFGAEKSCKSLLAYYFGKCTVNGVRVFDYYDAAQCPCLYLDAEDGILGEYAGWMRGIGKEMMRLKTLRTGIPALDDPALLEICRTTKPLIIVDSLHKFLEQGSNPWNSAQYEPVLAKLRLLCIAGATVIVIHHATRADNEKYRDSSAIGAGVDFLYAVVAEKGEDNVTRVKLIGKPSRGAQPPTLHLIGFPALINDGKFAIEDKPPKSDVDIVVEFAATHKDVTKRSVRKGVKGMSNPRKDAALVDAVKVKRLLLTDGIYNVPGDGARAVVPDAGHNSGTMTYGPSL